jgi:hypothetical protein
MSQMPCNGSRFKPLRNKRQKHCGNCRLWKANQASYTNQTYAAKDATCPGTSPQKEEA